MWDDDEALALARFKQALGRRLGHSTHWLIPPVTHMAGDTGQRPRLREDEVVQIRVAVGQARLERLHEAYICWEVQH